MISDALKMIQERDGLTDGELAAKLGIHRVTWSDLKRGRAGLGLNTIRKAVRSFPEIIEAVLCELYGEDYREIILPILTGIIAEMKARQDARG